MYLPPKIGWNFPARLVSITPPGPLTMSCLKRQMPLTIINELPFGNNYNTFLLVYILKQVLIMKRWYLERNLIRYLPYFLLFQERMRLKRNRTKCHRTICHDKTPQRQCTTSINRHSAKRYIGKIPHNQNATSHNVPRQIFTGLIVIHKKCHRKIYHSDKMPFTKISKDTTQLRKISWDKISQYKTTLRKKSWWQNFTEKMPPT